MSILTPKDRSEQIALFRHQVISPLVLCDVARGQLHTQLIEISKRRFRAPDAKSSRNYSVTTLERWYYAFKRGGLQALKPDARSDRGRGRALTEAQKQLVLDIRRENPTVSASVVMRTLIADGRLVKGQISVITLRRLFRDHRLDRETLTRLTRGKTRLRWEAARPNALWHGDVCHAAPIIVSGTRLPVKIHALLDDASRYVVAIEAQHSEREVDMLAILVDTLRQHGAPDALYLDNGATYSGDALRVACGRLGISLLHARPYDPEARGKMERFWRTLREGCLDHLGSVASLHDVQVRMRAFMDQHYHHAPHAGLLGKTPAEVWRAAAANRPTDTLDEAKLRDALTVRARRRVRRDSTLSILGIDWQVDAGFLAGQLVTVAYVPIDRPLAPWIEHQERIYLLREVDPKVNGQSRRREIIENSVTERTIAFDPAGALLDREGGPSARGGEQ